MTRIQNRDSSFLTPKVTKQRLWRHWASRSLEKTLLFQVVQSRNWKPVAVKCLRQMRKHKRPSLDCTLFPVLHCSPPQSSEAVYWKPQFPTPHNFPLFFALPLNDRSHLPDSIQLLTSVSTNPPTKLPQRSVNLILPKTPSYIVLAKGTNCSENFVIFTWLSVSPSSCLDNVISMPLFFNYNTTGEKNSNQ